MFSKIRQTHISLLYLVTIHVLGLVCLSVFRLIEYLFLHYLCTGEANSFTAFVRGVWFDNVILCYISLLPIAFLLGSAIVGYHRRWTYRAVAVWYSMWMTLALAVSAANTPYFQYFHKNINSSIFEWFSYTGTTAGMLVEEKSYLVHIALFLVVAGLFWWSALRLGKYWYEGVQRMAVSRADIISYALRTVVMLLVGGLCVFGIRGRTGYNPIKISQAYYCNDAFLNQLGINPAFNLLTSALDDMRSENRELHLMPYGKAITMARSSLGIGGKTDSAYILRRYVRAEGEAKKYNVVIILMESMSAPLLESFGNRQHLTPTLDSLYRHSLAFSRFYSAGIHTNHGMTATLYSFPALMFRNLMKGTVTPRRDGIPTVLKREGYHNMFFMTHEAQYDNMKAFFSTNGYDDIYSQENYPKSEVVNSFGVPDHYLFQYALPVINRQAATGKPFMATLLTISNHPPYMIPAFFKPHSSEPEMQIVEYADWAIGDFLRKASRESWYRNTIFVVLADHGKIVGTDKSELADSYNHIPLMIFGPGVEPQLYDGLGMQVDVMPTLLGMLNMSYVYDGFGVNLLKERRDRVFYSADNQIVGRDASRRYIYAPKMQKSFCYDDAEKLVPASKAYQPLEEYAKSMIQTAEYIYRKGDMER
uniref:LTA synthase family protein n=1 Tax=Prevotella sp. GTC17254 TaxID=3236794 RepID=A0AB33IXE2_9BACT